MNQRKIPIFTIALCMLMAFPFSGIYAIKHQEEDTSATIPATLDELKTGKNHVKIRKIVCALSKGSLGFLSGSLAATAVIIAATCNHSSQKPYSPLFLTTTFACALSSACITNTLAQHYPKTILGLTCAGIGLSIAHIMQVMR